MILGLQVLQPTGPPSKVLLLRNMVGPGEVDEGLEDEVAEEVAKFGDVLRVLIFEVSGPVAREQAVRAYADISCRQIVRDQSKSAITYRQDSWKLMSDRTINRRPCTSQELQVLAVPGLFKHDVSVQ